MSVLLLHMSQPRKSTPINMNIPAPETNNERDRRLLPGEEERIRKVLAGDQEYIKSVKAEVAMKPENAVPFTLMFELEIETAMRMREIFTLTVDQIDLPNRTIFLDRTKNGSKRQVPLSSVAVRALLGVFGTPTGLPRDSLVS